jgi:hypothetical protein
MMNWKERSGNGIHVSVHRQLDPDFLALSALIPRGGLRAGIEERHRAWGHHF